LAYDEDGQEVMSGDQRLRLVGFSTFVVSCHAIFLTTSGLSSFLYHYSQANRFVVTSEHRLFLACILWHAVLAATGYGISVGHRAALRRFTVMMILGLVLYIAVALVSSLFPEATDPYDRLIWVFVRSMQTQVLIGLPIWGSLIAVGYLRHPLQSAFPEPGQMSRIRFALTMLTAWVCLCILALRVGIMLIPAVPTLVAVGVGYTIFGRRWQLHHGHLFSITAPSHLLRTILLLSAFIAMIAAWTAPVLTGAGPDSGSSFAPYWTRVLEYVVYSGEYADCWANGYFHLGGFLGWITMVYAWSLPVCLLIGALGTALSKRPAFGVSGRPFALLFTLFAVFLPLWGWGPAGMLNNVAAGLALASVSTLGPQETAKAA
jgi:hypothetical protein